MCSNDRNTAETALGTFLSKNSMAIKKSLARDVQGAQLGISYNIQPLFKVRVGRERGRRLVARALASAPTVIFPMVQSRNCGRILLENEFPRPYS